MASPCKSRELSPVCVWVSRRNHLAFCVSYIALLPAIALPLGLLAFAVEENYQRVEKLMPKQVGASGLTGSVKLLVDRAVASAKM